MTTNLRDSNPQVQGKCVDHRSVVDVINRFGGNLDFPKIKKLKKSLL